MGFHVSLEEGYHIGKLKPVQVDDSVGQGWVGGLGRV